MGGYRILSSNTKVVNLHVQKFDLVIVAECLWRDTYCQHENLLKSCCEFLADHGTILVAHTFHNPGYEEKDLEFFARASNEFQLGVKPIETRKNMPYIDGSEGDESDVYLKKMVRKKFREKIYVLLKAFRNIYMHHYMCVQIYL